MMAAFAEGLALTGQLGLSQQDLLDVVALGAIACPMYALKGPNMAKVRAAGRRRGGRRYGQRRPRQAVLSQLPGPHGPSTSPPSISPPTPHPTPTPPTQGAYPTAFPLKHQQKDLRLALAAADAAGQPLAVAAAANDLYIRAKGAGRGDDDFSAVLAAVAKQQGAQ
jgi:glyoxylate/succinic semialdehyde reductase